VGMDAEVAERFVHAAGVRWRYREAGTGRPVVLLHGGGGTGKAFWHQLQGLSDRYRVLAPDLPGFGQTEEVADARTVDDLAPLLLEWLEAVGVTRAALGGNSMGGRVALAAALQAPERFSHLILLDAVGVLLPDVPVTNPLAIPPAQYVAQMVYDPDHYRAVTPYRTLQDAQELNAGRGVFRRYLEAAPIGPDRRGELGRLTMPVLLIWGRHDRIVPLPYGQALADLLPHAELNVIETAGHLPHIEEAAAVNQLIAHWLEHAA
jgi:2-hydroxy-6-oxonona-2,4-dienedioate hydrolase